MKKTFFTKFLVALTALNLFGAAALADGDTGEISNCGALTERLETEDDAAPADRQQTTPPPVDAGGGAG